MADRSAAHWEPWQLPYRHGTLAIWPPHAVRDYVNQLRERLDPISQRYAEAHITLTQPFREPMTKRVVAQVRAVLETEEPFTITYGPLRSFLPNPVLWLDVQPSDRVLRLRQKLHAVGVFDLSLPHTDDFVPHMTLTEGLSGTPVDDELFRMLEPTIKGGSFVAASRTFGRTMSFALELNKRLHSMTPKRRWSKPTRQSSNLHPQICRLSGGLLNLVVMPRNFSAKVFDNDD